MGLSIEWRTKWLLLLMMCWSLSNTSWALDQVNTSEHGEDEVNAAELYFTNVTLVNQHDQTRRLYRDLIKDKVVVINSFFTSCQNSCPIAMKRLASVQSLIPDNLGRRLHTISISGDPEVDTPAKLNANAKKVNLGPG